jgi:hypothetical protein
MHTQQRIATALAAISARDEDRAARVLTQLAGKYGFELVDDCDSPCLLLDATWFADDGSCEVFTDADNADDAQAEYVASGDWGSDLATAWVEVSAYQKAIDIYGETVEVQRETRSVEIQPTEPDCCGGDHEWASPIGVVGGIKENPGVWGHGGGVVIQELCVKCGCGKTTDTWAQSCNGEQGLHAVSYEEGQYTDAIEG